MKNHYYLFDRIKGRKNLLNKSKIIHFCFSLFEAIRILLENHVHRLPIIDPTTNNVVFILTHKRILRYFYLYVS
jgi:predicted transcriptional regulator